MLILLSPAKSLNFTTPPHLAMATQPEFVKRAETLIKVLQAYSPQEISALMDLSDKLAALNFVRYAEWRPAHTAPEAKQAVLAFDGDVYDGLDAKSLDPGQLEGYAQTHLGILSGLYGLLRPLDLIRPYRLEMGTRLAVAGNKNLYAYWGDTLAKAINRRLAEQKGNPDTQVVVNLASEEYFRAVHTDTLRARIVTMQFQDWRDGRYKIISFNAKRARGAMARYAIEQQVEDVENFKDFDGLGYVFDPAASENNNWIFRRQAD
ncbi:MAG: peroxide stress protein YaaA [Betaproteobacteria bacterium]|nr:peroxide stress protein YaaA [Betaproteobacteria bacterium]